MFPKNPSTLKNCSQISHHRHSGVSASCFPSLYRKIQSRKLLKKIHSTDHLRELIKSKKRVCVTFFQGHWSAVHTCNWSICYDFILFFSFPSFFSKKKHFSFFLLVRGKARKNYVFCMSKNERKNICIIFVCEFYIFFLGWGIPDSILVCIHNCRQEKKIRVVFNGNFSTIILING